VNPAKVRKVARAAEVKDVVTRAISGHATETMQRHYSTVSAAMAEVIQLAAYKKVAGE